MDPRLLSYYNRELQHLREMGGEFAREYPKIAGRLGMEGLECADPYVERLLEGFSFLAARVQLKIDSEFSTFTRHLLELVYPTYLAPTPSMTVAQFHPDPQEGQLAAGIPLPRGTSLRGLLGKGDQTPCEYRTASEVTLFPLQVEEAAYVPGRDLASLGLAGFAGAKAGIRIRFRTTGGQSFHEVALDRLPIFLHGADELPMRLLEMLLGHSLAVGVRSASASDRRLEMLDRSVVQPYGFSDEEALLPVDGRTFQGYRLLQEYFAFPERFRFIDLKGLERAVRGFKTDAIDLVFPLDSTDDGLEGIVGAANFQLFCAPAINLFARRADRIHVTEGEHEYHLVPDRTRPLDYEVYTVTGIEGVGATPDDREDFLPFYALHDTGMQGDRQAYYAIRRLPRALSAAQKRSGPRSHYMGHEVYVSIVDASSAPFPPDLRQLSVQTLCTNRDLPLHLPIGRGNTDFSLEEGAPVESVRCVAGPTRPRGTHVEGETAWRLINHLSLNYLSLCDSDAESGAAALRELLRLYGDTSEAYIAKQVEGVRSARTRPVTRRLPIPGPITFGRGLEVTVQLDDTAFEGTGMFLLGAVLDQFLARYVSINSFTETVIESVNRGEVMRWPMRTGLRPIL